MVQPPDLPDRLAPDSFFRNGVLGHRNRGVEPLEACQSRRNDVPEPNPRFRVVGSRRCLCHVGEGCPGKGPLHLEVGDLREVLGTNASVEEDEGVEVADGKGVGAVEKGDAFLVNLSAALQKCDR